MEGGREGGRREGGMVGREGTKKEWREGRREGGQEVAKDGEIMEYSTGMYSKVQ